MALVAFLKGVNVGGHRSIRPSALAQELKQYGLVSIGAAGTFVARKAVGREKLRSEILRRLPFQAALMICDGREILELAASDPFAGQPSGPEITRFVSIAGEPLGTPVELPLNLPRTGRWSLKLIALQGRFVLGIYRREMKAISQLSQLEKVTRTPLTTRNWNTILSIARVLAP